MKLRTLNFVSEQQCIDDVKALRSGYRAGGNWSLAQACWHLNFPIEQTLRTTAASAPALVKPQMLKFIDTVIVSGWPSGAPAPGEMVPPGDADEAAIDALLVSLERFSKYDKPEINAFLFGTLETEKFRRFGLSHAAHHLSFFAPAK